MALPKIKDFTVFCKAAELKHWSPDLANQFDALKPTTSGLSFPWIRASANDGPEKGWRSLNTEVRVIIDDEERAEGKDKGLFRAIVCRCFKGEWVSCTLRAIESGGATSSTTITLKKGDLGPLKGPANPLESSGFKERTKDAEWKLSDKGNSYLFAAADQPRILFNALGEPVPEQGLIVVSGRTKTGKSTVAKMLAHFYLQKQVNEAATKGIDQVRRPHLVTFEDPIEERFTKDPAEAKEFGVDYTARDLNYDTASLQDGLRDCLRQTPSVVFVGEVRRHEDWNAVLDFAATGHLCITTTHAGSLCETIRTLMEVRNADTASARSSLANRLLMVAHVNSTKIKLDIGTGDGTGPREMSCTLPAIWRRTSRGISGLVSDGLASLVPHAATKGVDKDDCGSIGRFGFAEKLLHMLEDRLSRETDPSWKAEVEAKKSELLSSAMQSDIEGM